MARPGDLVDQYIRDDTQRLLKVLERTITQRTDERAAPAGAPPEPKRSKGQAVSGGRPQAREKAERQAPEKAERQAHRQLADTGPAQVSDTIRPQKPEAEAFPGSLTR